MMMLLSPSGEESSRSQRCWHVVSEFLTAVLNKNWDGHETARQRANSCIHYSIPKEVVERHKVKSTFLLLRCPVDIQISDVQMRERKGRKVIVKPSPFRRRMVVAIKKEEGDLRTEREHDLVNYVLR